jgi:glycosyltransferase involved in cell wall biosynthesis
MDLAINGVRLMGKRYGVGRYLEYLLRQWKETAHPFERIVVYTPGSPEEGIELPPKAEHQIVLPQCPYACWEQGVLARLQRQHDLLFCPSYVVPLLGHGKTVLTHLGSYEALPSAFPLIQRWKSRLIYQLSALRADRVITVSESSKRDIVRFYRVRSDKIMVIPLGVDPVFRPIGDRELLASTRKKYIGSDRPYILFVGKLSRRRHIPELVAAFGRLKRSRDIPHVLLFIGPDTVGQDVPGLARTHGVESSVVHHEYASHEELVVIYNAADLFIYPSAYEGFGIPVLEAMACGIPTIALSNSSFLEFAAGVAYLAQDGQEEELFRAMDLVLFDEELRAKMRAAGPERARRFGWASIARQTMDVLVEVANQ